MFNEYFHGDNAAGLGADPPDRLDRDRRRHHPAPARSGAVHRRRHPRAGRSRHDRQVTTRRLPGQAGPAGRDAAGPTARTSPSRPRPTACCCACSTHDGTETQIPLPERDGEVWHGFVPGVGPGQAYGYRATGPYDPRPRSALQPGEAAARSVRPGHRRRGAVRAGGARLRGRRPGGGRARWTRPDTSPAAWWSTRPSTGATVPGPGYSYADTIIYEVHVKGFTAAHPGVPEELRGTYAGLAHDAAVAPPGRPRGDRGGTAPGAPQRARGFPGRARA